MINDVENANSIIDFFWYFSILLEKFEIFFKIIYILLYMYIYDSYLNA